MGVVCLYFAAKSSLRESTMIVRPVRSPKRPRRPSKSRLARQSVASEWDDIHRLRKAKKKRLKRAAKTAARKESKAKKVYTPRKNPLGPLDYPAYMESLEWQIKAGEMKRKRRCCEDCGSRESLRVHHLTYERLGCERDTDLLVVCRHCHELRHGA